MVDDDKLFDMLTEIRTGQATVIERVQNLSEKLDDQKADNALAHTALFEKTDKAAAEIAALKVKSGIWGAMGGILTGGPALIYLIIRSMGKW